MNLKNKSKAELQSICKNEGIVFDATATNAELRLMIKKIESTEGISNDVLEALSNDNDTDVEVVSDASLKEDIQNETTTENVETTGEVWTASFLSKGKWLTVEGEFSSSGDASLAAKKRGGHCIKTFIKTEV